MAENDKLFDSDGRPLKSNEKNERGFNSRSYANLLENKVIPSILSKYKAYSSKNDLSQLIYIQDNSRVHLGKVTNEDATKDDDSDKNKIKTYTPIDIIERSGIQVETEWPPYSPDLNPVENVWEMINREKNKILDKIEFKDYPKNKFESLKLVKKAFDNVNNSDVVNCYNSFRNRLKLVLLNEGNNNFDYSYKKILRSST